MYIQNAWGLVSTVLRWKKKSIFINFFVSIPEKDESVFTGLFCTDNSEQFLKIQF